MSQDLGALAVNTYLGLNPNIASKLSGVIYSAPLFGFYKKENILMKLFVSILGLCLPYLILVGTSSTHRISRNKVYLRSEIENEKKSFGVLSASLLASLNRNQSRI